MGGAGVGYRTSVMADCGDCRWGDEGNRAMGGRRNGISKGSEKSEGWWG